MSKSPEPADRNDGLPADYGNPSDIEAIVPLTSWRCSGRTMKRSRQNNIAFSERFISVHGLFRTFFQN
jgi:hypothetical protein